MTSGALYHLVTTCLVSCFDFSILGKPNKVVLDFNSYGLFYSTQSSPMLSTVMDFTNYFLLVLIISPSGWTSFYPEPSPIFKQGLSSLPYFFFWALEGVFCSSSYCSWMVGDSSDSMRMSGSSLRLLDNPKSQIWMVQSSFTKMFSGFKSRWQIYALCK
jgi:hypothetical protein